MGDGGDGGASVQYSSWYSRSCWVYLLGTSPSDTEVKTAALPGVSRHIYIHADL